MQVVNMNRYYSPSLWTFSDESSLSKPKFHVKKLETMRVLTLLEQILLLRLEKKWMDRDLISYKQSCIDNI